MNKYEIVYTVYDEWTGSEENAIETFEGTFSEMQDYIRILREADWCYNISVADITPECYE